MFMNDKFYVCVVFLCKIYIFKIFLFFNVCLKDKNYKEKLFYFVIMKFLMCID